MPEYIYLNLYQSYTVYNKNEHIPVQNCKSFQVNSTLFVFHQRQEWLKQIKLKKGKHKYAAFSIAIKCPNIKSKWKKSQYISY